MQVRWLGVKGRLSSGISDADVTITSDGLADLPEIVAPDYAIIVLDPDGVSGRPEAVRVTAHAASATSATVEREVEQSYGGSPARAHAANMNWYHAAIPKDFHGLVSAADEAERESYIVDDGTTVWQEDTSERWTYMDGATPYWTKNVSTHEDLPDLATSGHPVSVITGALSAAAAAAAYQPLDADLTAIAALTSPATTITGAVPKSTVTTAGDLIYGTAADTVARLPLGTAGKVLTVNAGATGLEWAAASGGGAAPMASPNNQGAVQWDIPGATFTAVSNEGFLANTVYYQPFVVAAGRTITISAIGIRVHTLGASGHAILGCYAATSLLQPTGASLFSSGVLDTSTTGVKQTTGLSVTLGEGVYLISLGLDVNVRLYVMRGPGIPGAQGFYNWDYSTRTFQRSRTYDGTNPNPLPDWNDNGLGSGFDHFVGLKYTVGTA